MTGIELIAQERQRQIEDFKWGENQYNISGALCLACEPKYRHVLYQLTGLVPQPIYNLVKKSNASRIRELAKAGALIAAEIDRLQAIEGKENE